MAEALLTLLFGIIVIGAAIVVALLEYYYTKTKVSAVSSLPWMRRAVANVLKKHLRDHRFAPPVRIYEMGSGWGPLAIDAARAFPEGRVVGLELSPVPFWFSVLRKKLFGHKNLRFKRGDFFKEDLSDADVVMLYMLESILMKLKPKFEKELKPGALVISNTFQIEGWTPVDVETVMKKPLNLSVYVYRIPDSLPVKS